MAGVDEHGSDLGVPQRRLAIVRVDALATDGLDVWSITCAQLGIKFGSRSVVEAGNESVER
jgi:hypothetical protein